MATAPLTVSVRYRATFFTRRKVKMVRVKVFIGSSRKAMVQEYVKTPDLMRRLMGLAEEG